MLITKSFALPTWLVFLTNFLTNFMLPCTVEIPLTSSHFDQV